MALADDYVIYEEYLGGIFMYDKIFENFKLKCKVSNEIITKYEKVLPNEMLDVWKEYGFGTILDGYLKIINPEEYEEVLDMSYFRASVATPIFVTAFGDVIALEEGRYLRIIKFKNGTFDVIPGGFDFFWEDLEGGYIKEINNALDKYKDAVAKLGELEFDECFGYTPLLGLGGSEKTENLEKVNTKVHIELITQMVGRIE